MEGQYGGKGKNHFKCAKPEDAIVRFLALVMLFFLPFSPSATAEGSRGFLVSQGRARAAIVAGNGEFCQFVGKELQRYLEAFSGAKLEILTPEEARKRPKDWGWILVGGPQANELVREAVSRRLVNFEGLKPEGFILRTTRLEGRRVLVVGGNEEAASMYAAYDLLERYGAVFLLTGDILPEKKADLEFRDFDVRSDPAFRRRGFLVSFIYPNRSIMSMQDEREFLDQMAKMKMNYLQIFWFPYEPWLKYEYRGEAKWMGDVARKETGYVLWARDFGSFMTSEMKVGREHFKKVGVYPRLAPPEFQQIENNEQAFEAAQKYLHEVIAYAASRKIKVWLDVDATSVVPNLARYTTRTLTLPFHPIFGTFMCPDNPVSLELNENRLNSLVRTYSDAEGFFLYLPEAYPVCNQDGKDRQFYQNLRSQYPGEAEARAAFTGDIAQDNATVIDSNSGSVYFVQNFMEARDRMAPGVKLGIGGLGRLYLWPNLHKMFPASVPFTDMESRAIWTPTGVPMEMFGGMGERENTLLNRIDDDSDMLGMQFNVNLYYKDRVLEGGLKYGLAGFASQMNRARGTETNTKYMADGEWNPHLTPQEFYRDYASRIFGERALPRVLKAFQTLEKNEEYLGWTGRGNFSCCGPPEELSVAYQYSKQPNPFDGPRLRGWRPYITRLHNQIAAYTGSIEMLQEALAGLQSARSDVAPSARAYLAFLTNRTEAYILHLQTLITWEQAYIDLDSAFATYRQGAERKEFLARLDKGLKEFEDARSKAVTMGEKWSEIVDHPSDLGVLYRINVFMVEGTELTAKLMENIDNFHHGRDYAEPVDFGKIYVSWPALEPPWEESDYVAPQ
ncbi:MAG: alpha-glucuronidase family glycosyl hydrolase [Terriglobia bacterium]